MYVRPKVSICIPAYNAVDFCREALASVSAQTIAEWELIVVEDGSDDGTSQVVQNFNQSVKNHVRYERTPSNCGVAATRNRLLELANGEYLAWLDADDVWAPDHLESCMTALQSGDSLCVAGIEIYDCTNTKSQRDYYCPNKSCFENPTKSLFELSFIYTSSSIVMIRSLAAQVGDFDEELRIGEDRDYWFRAALCGAKFAISPTPTVTYRKHQQNSMMNTLRVAADTTRFYRKHQLCDAIPESVRRHNLGLALLVEARLRRRESPSACLKLAIQALHAEPTNFKYIGFFWIAALTAVASNFLLCAGRRRSESRIC